jgi:hypothetical protein
MTLTLPLDVPEPDAPPEPTPAAAPLSKGRRRTARVAAAVAAGVHPLALIDPRVRMHPDADRAACPGDATGHLRCGSCAHRQPNWHGFPKCDLGPDSNAVTTDVRAWWPACTRYELGRS